jgi:hypothetical protein
MKRLLSLLLLASPLFGGWNYYRSVTVNSGQITGTLTNWPAPYFGTYAYLATVANGGLVQNSNGYDIAFFADSGLMMALPCEQENYIASSGSVDYFVDVSSIAVGTTIYIAYGNSSVSTPQCTGSGVWDANSSLVAHFPNGSVLSVADSTGNNTITNAGATATNTHCQIDGCASFVKASSQYMTVANTSSIELGTSMTFEFWLYINGQCGSAGTCNVYIDKVDRGGTGKGYFIGYNESSGGSNYIEFFLQGSTTSCDNYTGTISNNAVVYISATYDGSTMKVYQNGVQLSQEGGCNGSVAVGSTDTTHTLYIGQLSSGGGLYANGELDEIRISNTPRSAAWMTANYNAGSSQTGFWTIGSQVNLSSTVANPSVFGIAVQ